MKNILIVGATGGIGQSLVIEALNRWPASTIWAIGRSSEKLKTFELHDRVKTITAQLEDCGGKYRDFRQ